MYQNHQLNQEKRNNKNNNDNNNNNNNNNSNISIFSINVSGNAYNIKKISNTLQSTSLVLSKTKLCKIFLNIKLRSFLPELVLGEI